MQILIADDHWMVRELLKQVMVKLRRTMVIHEAASFDEAVAILAKHGSVDLMLADLIMPGFDEFEGLHKLRARFPAVPVAVVSVHEDYEYVMRALSHGVIGYIPKSAQGPELERAFERIFSGEVYFPRQILERGQGGVAPPAETAPVPDPGGLATLTNREREILGLLSAGNSISKIAATLDLASHTVRVHLGNLTRKLGLSDRAEVIHYAITHATELSVK